MTMDRSAVEEIAGLATAAATPGELDLGSYYTVVVGGQVHRIDLTGDEHRDQPRRKVGITVVRDVASFAAYWAKHHRDGQSEVYATRDALKVIAVLDAHGDAPEDTGWAQHRLVLQLKHSSAWNAWATRNNQAMDQETFAEFLEDNRADIHTPSAADMLEVAQSIQAATKVDFSSGYRLADGQRILAYTETVQARAGQKGELAIPAEIVLRLPVFEGATEADLLTARFRHRLASDQLRLSYKLDRPEEIIDAAFEGVVAAVAQLCATPMRGTPA